MLILNLLYSITLQLTSIRLKISKLRICMK